MHYYKCPTCGRILADKILVYRNEYLKISNDGKMSDEDKEKYLMELPKKLKINRYCCSIRLSTGIDETDVLV